MAEPITVVCGQCATVVRLPTDRLDQKPRCPKCHAPIFDGKPINLTTATFEKHVARSGLPLVVDFWAPWCGPCLSMAPFFEAAAKHFEFKLRFAKLNTEAEPAPASRYHIRSIPTMIVFRLGKEVARQSGAMDTSTLTRWLNTVI